MLTPGKGLVHPLDPCSALAALLRTVLHCRCRLEASKPEVETKLNPYKVFNLLQSEYEL